MPEYVNNKDVSNFFTFVSAKDFLFCAESLGGHCIVLSFLEPTESVRNTNTQQIYRKKFAIYAKDYFKENSYHYWIAKHVRKPNVSLSSWAINGWPKARDERNIKCLNNFRIISRTSLIHLYSLEAYFICSGVTSKNYFMPPDIWK